MKDKGEARIIVRHGPGLTAELSTYFVANRREVRTGMRAGPGAARVEAEVLKLKATLERAGHRVTVKEM